MKYYILVLVYALTGCATPPPCSISEPYLDTKVTCTTIPNWGTVCVEEPVVRERCVLREAE